MTSRYKFLLVIFLIFGLIFLLIFWYGMSIFNQESINPNFIEYFDKPNTLKEEKFVKSLKINGFDSIKFSTPNPSITDCGPCCIKFDKYTNTDKNQLDALKRYLRELSLQLYNHVLEDSILFVINKISITLSYDIKRGYRYESMYDIHDEISKDSLEILSGFSVIKTNKGYKRIYTNSTL